MRIFSGIQPTGRKHLGNYIGAIRHDPTAILLAGGVDPERCTTFRRSDVAEHSELCWLLCSVAAHGELERMTQFEDEGHESSCSKSLPPSASR
jgi:tryptophanyl-tRNA synthetase